MKKFISIILSVVLIITSFAAADFSAYAATYTQGIDVSSHNENFDFAKAKADGKKFVMLRLGYFTHLDTSFWEKVKACAEAKMNFGVYLFSYAYDNNEAQQEADFVIRTLNELKENEEYSKYFTLPVAYDIEDYKNDKMSSLGKTQITNQMVIFCDAVKAAGYTPMVYANKNFFTNYISLEKALAKKYKIWLAYYPSGTPNYSQSLEVGNILFKPDMWQYSDSGNLDKNVMYSHMSCNHTYKAENKIKAATTSAFGKAYTLYICTKCHYAYQKKTKTINRISSVSLSGTKLVYNGKVRTPTISVKDSKGNKIASSNYTVTYPSGRKNVGKYTVTVKFKGNYSGTVKKAFTINPKSTALSSVAAGKKKFTAKWQKQSTQTTGYQLQYSTSSKFSNTKTVTISSYKTTSKAVSKLQGKKKYYVRIRTYKTVSGTKYYSAWSKYKTVTTKS